MLRSLAIAAVLTAATFSTCLAAGPGKTPGAAPDRPFSPDEFPNGQPAYVQIIVKACHPAETALKPTNQGKIFDNAKAMTPAEQQAMFKKLGCVDIPVPMQWMLNKMTPRDCENQPGYITAMQFLEQRDASEHDGLTAVGGWRCIISNKPFVNTVGQ